jgi:hypothetical protein
VSTPSARRASLRAILFLTGGILAGVILRSVLRSWLRSPNEPDLALAAYIPNEIAALLVALAALLWLAAVGAELLLRRGVAIASDRPSRIANLGAWLVALSGPAEATWFLTRRALVVGSPSWISVALASTAIVAAEVTALVYVRRARRDVDAADTETAEA